MKRWLSRIALSVVGVYLALCALMFAVQRHILFHPGARDVALDVGLLPGARVEVFTTSDGETLKSWWLPPADDTAAVYLYLHGNSETLANRAERLAFLTQHGAGVLALSWRGYGGSSGAPTKEGLQRDALAAYEWLSARVASRRIIVFGESLGTAMALELAAERETAALVLDSAYTSIAEVARHDYPWLPVDLLLRDRFDNLTLAPKLSVPVRAMHCRDDYVVPYALGLKLFEAIGGGDKTLTTVERRCHVPNVVALEPALRELEARVRLTNTLPAK